MAHYAYYEFLAVDRPLSHTEMDEAYRQADSEAEITSDRLLDYGEPEGDVEWLMRCFYDVHLYCSEYGEHTLVIRWPAEVLPEATARRYALEADGAWIEVRTDGPWTIWQVQADHEDDLGISSPVEELIDELAPLRAEVAAGDMRGLYLAWLAVLRAWELADDEEEGGFATTLEPPVPAGLGRLTAAQRCLATFLGVDADLLAAAAQASPDLPEPDGAPSGRPGAVSLRERVAVLDPAVKDDLLTRLARGEIDAVTTDLAGRLGSIADPGTPAVRVPNVSAVPAPASRRTASALLDAADRLRIARRRAAGRPD